MPAELDPDRLRDFAQRLAVHPRGRVDQHTLWAAFAAAFRGRPQGAEERRWLQAALEGLAASGLVRLPSIRGRRWDRALGVAIPTSVDLVRDQTPPPAACWRKFPWHPRLQWINDLRHLTADQEQFLRRIHDGIVQGWFGVPAPLKYLSLQLTGDEKRLRRLMDTKLFGPGRLDTDLLGCSPEVVPLAWESISAKPSLIIFENAGPFCVARTVLGQMPDSPYGMVGYGGGTRFELSIRHLLSIGRSIEQIEYLGDLDWDGLGIALAAKSAARVAGLPEIQPARGLHRAMLDASRRFGSPLGWPADHDCRPDPRLVDFLPHDVRRDALRILHAGNRIPEEVLGPDELKGIWLGQKPL